jgi:hypothetical protein
MEIGSIADWVSGVGSLLAVIFVIIQMKVDKETRLKSLRISNMAKYRKLNSRLKIIKNVSVSCFLFDIEYVTGNAAPYTCILLQAKMDGENKYFRSEVVSYLEKDKSFRICLPRSENLKLENVFIISKDENGVTYAQQHKWYDRDSVFIKSEVLENGNNNYTKLIQESIIIDQSLYPCRDIINNFSVIDDFYGQKDSLEQKIHLGPDFKKSENSREKIDQLLKVNPQLFKKTVRN